MHLILVEGYVYTLLVNSGRQGSEVWPKVKIVTFALSAAETGRMTTEAKTLPKGLPRDGEGTI